MNVEAGSEAIVRVDLIVNVSPELSRIAADVVDPVPVRLPALPVNPPAPLGIDVGEQPLRI